MFTGPNTSKLKANL